ncbi:MAG: type 4a pilus biogenesis protein PilO [Candidatus Paceibacterota bacterium]|jgi:Tfp pilus assembly protein PilO
MSAVFIIGALVVFTSFIRPAYKTIAEKRAEVSSREKTIKEAQITFDQVQEMLSSYKNLGELQNKISLTLPQDQALASALYQLTNLASNNGVNIETVTVSEPPVVPAGEENTLMKGIGTVRFTLKAVGSYGALNDLLSKIETNVRIFDLSALKVERVNEKTSNSFNFDIGVDTYYLSK